jgi:hypothetical protein
VKGKNLLRLVILGALLIGALVACEASPKSRADDFITYIPEEFGEWEQDDMVKLLTSTVTSQGHVTLTYQGPDDAVAYIVIDAYPTADAAEVAATNRERELLLMGLQLDASRAPQQVTAQIAIDGRIRYALMEENKIVVEVNALAASDAEEPVSEEVFEELLTVVRRAYEVMAEE